MKKDEDKIPGWSDWRPVPSTTELFLAYIVVPAVAIVSVSVIIFIKFL